MRPIPSKNFGSVKNKLAVKFHNGSALVTGSIIKQLGNKRFMVQKDAYTAICTLAQNADDVTAMTGGDVTICAIAFTPFGGSASYVRSIANKTLVAHDGNRYSYQLGVTATSDDQGALALIANKAPVVNTAMPDLVATVGSVFTYTVPLATFTDLDGDALTYTAKLQSGAALPSWLSFDPSTRVLSGTPVATGTVLARVTASDGTDSANDDFTITIS